MADRQDVFTPQRRLPPMNQLLDAAGGHKVFPRWPRSAWVDALRAELERLRNDATQAIPGASEIVAQAAEALARAHTAELRRVLNATGIVVHTNLGRAKLAQAAVEAIVEAAGNCTLEFDTETGRRGPRAPGVEALLRQVSGAAAALAVNNNAAALLLALSALAPEGEVIVSRGELIEIGGGFRIPDIIQQGGARLLEVGTTNRTRLADYEAAITPRTRLLLKVHQSNFAMVGFTEETSLTALSALARARELVLLNDLGSGNLAPLPGPLALREPSVAESIAAGSDLVAFSGDKLLGGPQAGLLVGRADLIDSLRHHPLLRALRLDKLSLAALEATLRLHTDPMTRAEVPVLRMLGQSIGMLQVRAERLAEAVAGLCAAEIVASIGHAGGGALPGLEIASRALSVSVAGLPADELARRLRAHRPAVVGRIAAGRVLLDMLTLADDELAEVVGAVRAAVA